MGIRNISGGDLIAALAFGQGTAAQTVWHVPEDFGIIQVAIDAAGDGDEILGGAL
jgi:hypothetical protein